jgi:hypothetical protein
MSTALCIVPPEDAWDAMQRARHAARDPSFYRWPPALRLFHPFAPAREVPGLAGRLAEWMDEREECENDANESGDVDLRSFEVTLDSILILPHWEVLDAKIDALEQQQGVIMPKGGGGRGRPTRGGRRGRSPSPDSDWSDVDADGTSSTTQEHEYLKRREEGRRLIEDEERKGIERKRARERKRRGTRPDGGDGGGGGGDADEGGEDDIGGGDDEDDVRGNAASSSTTTTERVATDDGGGDGDDGRKKNGNNYNGPCVIYLSPNDESRRRLESLRETLRRELFGEYDAFSPASPVSPHPERLPRPRAGGDGAPTFRALLPVGRFSTVDEAVRVARAMQRSWDPLSFNVTDLQFVSRRGGGDDSVDDDRIGDYAYADHRDGGVLIASDGGGGSTRTTTTTTTTTTTGEVDDVSRRGVYGCDVMVMLLGEEPEEALMEDEASLSMMMMTADADDDGGDDGGGGGAINYDEVFTTAEREFQRMRAHEESPSETITSPASSSSSDDDDDDDDATAATTDIEAWLDDDEDDVLRDEGATVVIGRAQFFMGAMREFVG